MERSRQGGKVTPSLGVRGCTRRQCPPNLKVLTAEERRILDAEHYFRARSRLRILPRSERLVARYQVPKGGLA